jgi:hypothetical protein
MAGRDPALRCLQVGCLKKPGPKTDSDFFGHTERPGDTDWVCVMGSIGAEKGGQVNPIRLYVNREKE